MKPLHQKIVFYISVLVISVVFSTNALSTGNGPASPLSGKGFILASTSDDGTSCSAPVPVLFEAVPGNGQIIIKWSNEHTGNPDVAGYNIYYDRSGKSEPVTTVWRQDKYTRTGLTNGQEYCFKVTSLYAECESVFSNVLCAVPAAQTPQK